MNCYTLAYEGDKEWLRRKSDDQCKNVFLTPTIEQVPSSQRAVPLRGRKDLVVQSMEFQGVTHYVIKDPVGLTYNRLRGDQYRALLLLNGERSLEEIRDELVRAFPAISPTLTETQQLIADLHQKGLAFGVRPGQGSMRVKQQRKTRRQKILSGFANILSLRIPVWDPDAVLNWLLPRTRWMFQPVAATLAVLFVLCSWLLVGIRFAEFQAGLPAFRQFFGWPNLLFLWCTLPCAKILHEFGHGLSCKYFGGECHEMGIMLLVGSPCLYCDVSDCWMLKNKWSRILIGAAGMLVEMVLSAVAIFVWWLTSPGLLHYLSLNLFFVTAVTTVIFNANPLMRLDGYYMLSDFLEIPNLRPKADKLLREEFARICFGIEPRHDAFMPQRGKPLFALFAVASTLYGWSVLFGILTFLYTVLKPHDLQSLGQTFAVFSFLGIVGQMGMNGYRMITQPRDKPIHRVRMWVSVTLILSVFISLCLIPIPLFRSAPFVIEPRDVQHLYTKMPGELIELAVEPGQFVKAGQHLGQLRDPRSDDRLHELETRLKQQLNSVDLAISLSSPSSRVMAEKSLESLQEQLDELKEQMKKLELVAPVSGIVIAPPRQPAPKLEQMKTRLVGWTGTPLDSKNDHCVMDERTHFLSIAPSDTMQAILYLDQADRNDVQIGFKVGLKFEHLPSRVYRGTISQLATAQSDFAPDILSVKHGGLLPTVSNRENKEKLEEAAYQATVLLDESPELMRTNLRGNARFIVAHRSVFDWVWRYLRRTFYFRL